MTQETISIIIPVHNAQDTLREALESALSQTYTNLEILLVDNGSTDESGALCNRLGTLDKRIRVFHRQDKGVSEARNMGLSHALGEWITFLDADDVLHPQMLSVLAGLLRDSGADVAGCGFEKRGVGAASFVHASKYPDSSLVSQDGILTGEEIITKGILLGDTRVWSKLFRRSYTQEHFFTKGLTIGEDLLYLAELSYADASYVWTNRELYSYFCNPKGAMERPFDVHHMDQLRCWDLVFEKSKEKFPHIWENEDAMVRLKAQQLIAAVLTASKIAKLPLEQQKNYRQEYEICRKRIREIELTQKICEYLPSGYRSKIRMLLYAPGVYRKLYGALLR